MFVERTRCIVFQYIVWQLNEFVDTSGAFLVGDETAGKLYIFMNFILAINNHNILYNP